MTVRASKFTPEVLLSAPRRSSGKPNARGTLALFSVTTYSFESHSRKSEIRVLDIASSQSHLVTDDEKASDPNWIGDGNDVVWLKSGSDGKTTLVVANLSDTSKIHSYSAGVIDGPVSNIKLAKISDDAFAVAVVGQATPDGALYNPEKAPKQQSTGKVYTSLFVRHWDYYLSPQRNSIFYGRLTLEPSHVTNSSDKYTLSKLTNSLKGTGIESPIPPFGGTDHFDLSSSGIAFVAKDPDENPATNTKAHFYFIPIKTFTGLSTPEPIKVVVDGLEGACTSPVISPDGTKAVFLQMKKNGYESDKNRVILIPDLTNPFQTVELLASENGKGAWDSSPSSVSWSNDGNTLYLVAEATGRGILFSLPSNPADIKGLPKKLTTTGTVSDIAAASKSSNELFISSTSLVDNSYYSILDPAKPGELKLISSSSKGGKTFGLSQDQVSDIWFPGAGDYKVHAWVVKPSNFDSSKKYPLAYLIHGGPQGAWAESWSTRWNPAVFAEQGYVVITPNPTGSTSYGQDFVDAIQEEWGGRPYTDIVKGFEYIRDNLSYVDTDRAVALGASYGGYMMNWIQGNPLGRKFKALVTHDGVFSMANQISSDELYFPFHDLGGTLWDKRAQWERWDPSRLSGNWETPHLIIHNELDYRLPVSEGLAAFNVLQKRGVPSMYLTFPDENHWVLKPENSLQWHTVVLNWINKFAGLPPYKENNGGYEVNEPIKKMQDLKV
ncbi:alpha/beta-hydrolase [Xylona heveae TC161]|uniref:Dipeptidyl-peptidase V n=1 Tax=Xylona heveae (strain CBS 132557 / TC161) TaxID=1328760 RepID=A0A165J9X7_XYLHT|nr:alpha/beta-hydrolase [Xylona heveae TC161]KZF25951.1 alpha/beta-hydrolase [Xylona heveae TC161]